MIIFRQKGIVKIKVFNFGEFALSRLLHLKAWRRKRNRLHAAEIFKKPGFIAGP